MGSRRAAKDVLRRCENGRVADGECGWRSMLCAVVDAMRGDVLYTSRGSCDIVLCVLIGLAAAHGWAVRSLGRVWWRRVGCDLFG